MIKNHIVRERESAEQKTAAWVYPTIYFKVKDTSQEPEKELNVDKEKKMDQAVNLDSS